MSEPRTLIFITGVTGYIGGTVLYRLLQHTSAKTFDITALVRSPEKAKRLETFGVKGVVGSLDNSDLVEDLASKAHVIIDTADADHIEAIRAILRGTRKRHATIGDVPIYIHTSGTGEFIDDSDAQSNYVTDVIYDDLDVQQIESLPDSAVHRSVDLEIVAADTAGYVMSYILLPSVIYGLADNPLVQAGIQNPQSIQIPTLIKASLGRRQAGVVGKGVALWPNVHVHDVADLYIALFDAIVASPDKVGHGREGYYFGENGEHSWYSISRAIGEALVDLGISTDPEPTTFTDAELIKYLGSLWVGRFWGNNCRCRANRGRSIGWKPTHTVQDMLASIKPEVELILKQTSQ